MKTDLTAFPTENTLEAIRREVDADPYLRSRQTKIAYTSDLTKFETWRAGRPTTRRLVESYLVELGRQGHATSTINRALSAIRWWARRVTNLMEEFLLPDEARRAIAAQAAGVMKMRNLPGTHERPGRAIEWREVQDLLAACLRDESQCGTRDAALIAVAFGTGLRRAELAALEMRDYLSRTNEVDLLVRAGKGDENRTVPIPGFALRLLETYLELRGNADGPLFYRANRNRKLIYNRGISPEAIYYIFKRRVAEAGLDGKINPHDARRFVATEITAVTSLTVAADILGHKSTDTTRRYVYETEEKKRDAVRKLNRRAKG